MSARHGGPSPVCRRCGRAQPPAGELLTSDGTPIAASTYLALAGLVGDALVCVDCLSSPDVPGPGPARTCSGHPRSGSPRYTETPLDESECRRLLATQPIGRLAFTEQAVPVIVPAHFVVRGPEIILGGLSDGRVASARQQAVVAFGVDAYDAGRHGWWVCNLGRTRLITEPSQLRDLDALDFTPSADHPERIYLAIEVDMLRGTPLAPTGQPSQ